jgi:hypothetical protein
MSPNNETVDLQSLTIKEHLIILNEKMKELKEDTGELKKDTEIIKNNDRNKWDAIHKNEKEIAKCTTSLKIYLAITSVIVSTGVAVLCKILHV